MQEVIDDLYEELQSDYRSSRAIWDTNAIKRWGSDPATDKQKNIITRNFSDFDCTELTKFQASQILNRIFPQRRA